MKGRSLLARLRGKSPASGHVGVGMSDGTIALAYLPRPDAERPSVTARTLEVPAETTLSDALGKVVGELRLGETPCTLTLAPGDYQTFQIEKPPVEDAELVAAARWRVRELIDYPLDEAVIDVFEVPMQSQRGRPPSVMVVSAHKRLLRGKLDALEAAGLVPERIDIAELAIRNLLARLGEANESLATLYLGRHRGLIAITRGDRLYVARGVDYGYEDVRRELAPASDGGLALAGRADEFYDRIALEVQRTMDYFESYFGLGSAQRLVVAPGLPEFDELAERAGATLGVRAHGLPLDALVDLDAPAESLPDILLALGGGLSLPAGGEA